MKLNYDNDQTPARPPFYKMDPTKKTAIYENVRSANKAYQRKSKGIRFSVQVAVFAGIFLLLLSATLTGKLDTLSAHLKESVFQQEKGMTENFIIREGNTNLHEIKITNYAEGSFEGTNYKIYVGEKTVSNRKIGAVVVVIKEPNSDSVKTNYLFGGKTLEILGFKGNKVIISGPFDYDIQKRRVIGDSEK